MASDRKRGRRRPVKAGVSHPAAWGAATAAVDLTNRYTDDYGAWPLLAAIAVAVVALRFREPIARVIAESLILPRRDDRLARQAGAGEREQVVVVVRAMLVAAAGFAIVAAALAIVGLLP